MVICLERDPDLHMAQLMPLPLTVSCFSKIQIGFTFLVLAHPGSPGQRAIKRVCVCMCKAAQVNNEYVINRQKLLTIKFLIIESSIGNLHSSNAYAIQVTLAYLTGDNNTDVNNCQYIAVSQRVSPSICNENAVNAH